MGLNTALAPDSLVLKASHETKSNPVPLQLWEASKPAQRIKLLPAKTDDLSPVAGSHVVGEKRLLQLRPLTSTQAPWCVHTHTK